MMEDLGLALAWLVIQDVLVLAPAAVIHGWISSRRGPSDGAWLATVSLMLILALGVSAFLPQPMAGTGQRLAERGRPEPTAVRLDMKATMGPEPVRARIGPRTSLSPSWAGLRLAWERIEQNAAVPSARWRRWGRPFAMVAAAGMGVGLVRLALGVWAIGVCRRRGRVVEDGAMLALRDELRAAMGCHRPVELREVADLNTPATASWRRPVIMLPDDWRAWGETERRAVLAHELAHVVRRDYAGGMIARFAVVLHAGHPMVRWMAGRLLLQQEMAADALGARFSGGRATYLVALSRMALRQDGRSPGWPARAFLPRRGALIRRIAMLRDDAMMTRDDQAWPSRRRMISALGLLALTTGVASLRGPALADDVEAPARPPAASDPTPVCIDDNMDGVFAFRPAEAFRHANMNRLAPLVNLFLDVDLAEIAGGLQVDTTKPGFLKIAPQDVEWVACGVGFDVTPALPDHDKKLHRLFFGGTTVRMVAPFDWLTFLRQWRLELADVREADGVFHRITGLRGPDGTLVKQPMLEGSCVYLPDDRTLMVASEKAVRAEMGPDSRTPAYLRGPDWERARRGLVAFALSNRGGAFAKRYDLGRPDDAAVLSLVKEVDHWIGGVADADAIALHASASCRDATAAAAIAPIVRTLRTLGRASIGLEDDPESVPEGVERRYFLFLDTLLANLRVDCVGPSVTVRSEGFSTLAEFATLVEAGMKLEAEAQEKHRAKMEAEKSPVKP